MLLDQPWQDILAKIMRGIFALVIFPQGPVEQVKVEQVNAHVDQVGGWFFRFFDEGFHVVLFIHRQNAKTGGFFHRDTDGGHGQVSLVGQVVLDHPVVIHGIDVITGKDQDQVGGTLLDESKVLLDGIGGAFEPVGLEAGFDRASGCGCRR